VALAAILPFLRPLTVVVSDLDLVAEPFDEGLISFLVVEGVLRSLAVVILGLDLVAEPLDEGFVPFSVVEVGVVAPSVELLSDLGAFAAASESRFGRVEAAVCSVTFLLLLLTEDRRPLFAGGVVASSTAVALRFAGAIVNIEGK
jgi:hypothetical protein